MKTIKIALIIFLVSSISLFAETVIIANKGVADNSIDASTAGSIYSLDQKTWPGGGALVVVDMSGGAAKDAFYAFINKNPNAMKKAWLKKKLTSGAKTPEVVSNDADMVAKVASTPGAIGYCDKSQVTGDVKIIATF